MIRLVLIPLLFAAAPALATGCPAPPDHGATLSALIKEARNAPDEAAGRTLSDEMWALWADAPDARAQEMLDRAMARREMYDFEGALQAAESLIAYCPDYAEGYNQRAFLKFLTQDYEAALPDLDATLTRNPRHVAALTGKALTLHALGRNAEAALALRAALDLNPWLGERHLLPVLEAQEMEL
jgi:tetratricopeptide (TPR) repeat protein